MAKSAAEMSAPISAPATPPPPGQIPAGEPPVQVRSDFRSTVFWQPDVMTGKDGKATVKVTYPDSLTGWKATARAVTEANQFGIAECDDSHQTAAHRPARSAEVFCGWRRSGHFGRRE